MGITAADVFSENADGTNLRQVTGFGVLGQLPGPTGTVVGRVTDPRNVPGSITACIISAQGMNQITRAGVDNHYPRQYPSTSARDVLYCGGQFRTR